MSWTLSTLYPVVVITAFALFKLVQSKLSPRPAIFSLLDCMHPSPEYGSITFAHNVTKSIFWLQSYTNEGYQKFNKALDQPFALLTPWVRGARMVVLPASRIPLLARPDKGKDGEWTGLPGFLDTTHLKYVIDDADVYQNLLHFDVVLRHMGPSDMRRLAPTTADEIDLAFRDIWGNTTAWKTIDGWDECGKIISRVTQRILVGLPLSRDETMLETTRLYANSLLLGGAVISCLPLWVRWILAPLIVARARQLQACYVKMLVPVVKERIHQYEAGEYEMSDQDDFLQRMIPMCAKDPAQLDAQKIALRIASLLTPFVFAIAYVFGHCVLDISTSTEKSEILNGLEEECRRVSFEHGGLDSSASMNSLRCMDSVIRESMRVSDVMVTNIFRDVTAGEIDIGNGLRAGPGVRMVFPTQNIHMDPDNYDDPKRFDAFRFSRPFENTSELGNKSGEQNLATTPTPTFMPWGYGRHVCPGRYFAVQLMKQALSYLVINYEFDLVGPLPKRRALLNIMVPPVNTKLRIRRKTS